MEVNETGMVKTINPPRFAIIATSGSSLLNFRGPLIEDIVRLGWEVFAIAPAFDSATRKGLESTGATPIVCKFARTGRNPFSDTFAIVQLAHELKSRSIDTVLSYSTKASIYGTLGGWLAGVPNRFALVSGLGSAFSASDASLRHFALNKAVRLLYSLAMAKASAVFFQNDEDMAYFIDKRLVRREFAINTGGTGVDLNVWHLVPVPSDHSPVFLMAARLIKEKGVAEFVEAAKSVKTLWPEARFILLGDVDENPGSIDKDQLREWLDDGAIEWPGHVEVMPWLALASVFVLPTYYREGVPRSIQEAMAVGRAIITTDTPGCNRTVVADQNGFLIPTKNVAALVDAMLSFHRDPSLFYKMSAASRKLAEERFDVRRINRLMINQMKMSSGLEPRQGTNV